MEKEGDAAIRDNTIDDLRNAMAAARAAQPAWASLSLRKRGRIVRRMSRSIRLHTDEITAAITACTGKTRFDALSTEVLPASMAAAYYARAARRFLRKRRVRTGNLLMSYKRSTLLHEPWGVIGVISPWNFPFGIPFHEVVTGLMAGNAVILKVASLAGNAGELIREVVEEAGVPEGLFHLIHLPGRTAGPAFLEAGINKLFFIGSIPVGKELMRLAADRLTPVCLELGGNDAMIVCADAFLDRAVNGALWAGLSNCGQSCAGVERIYAHKSIVRPFAELLSERLTLLRVGREKEFDQDVGALATRRQYDTVKAHVEDALAKGARILAAAGPDDPDRLLHPAMLIDKVTPDMRLIAEETFGPILALDTFANEDEAVAKANAGIYGLTASVWSKRIRQAKKLAARLQAGAVTINDHLMSHGLAETHWGGYKQSGIGRSHGQMGFEEMTQTKVVVHDLLHRLPKNIWWYPHSKQGYTRLKGVIDLLYARNPLKKISGLGKLFALLRAALKKW